VTSHSYRSGVRRKGGPLCRRKETEKKKKDQERELLFNSASKKSAQRRNIEALKKDGVGADKERRESLRGGDDTEKVGKLWKR